MRRAWVVRAGETSKEIDAMRAAGIIGVRFETVGDVRGMEQREVEHAIAQSGQPGVENLRSRLMRFATDIKIGDLVVTPNLVQHDVWISIVTGPYQYTAEPAVPGYHHVHEVEWQGWVDRNASWLQNKLKYLEVPGAVVELRDPDWWMDQIGSRELPPTRPAGQFRPPPPPPPRAPRSSTPRAPRVPKPAPEPVKPKAPERMLCNGPCGLQWTPAVLVGGLCPDCRGD